MFTASCLLHVFQGVRFQLSKDCFQCCSEEFPGFNKMVIKKANDLVTLEGMNNRFSGMKLHPFNFHYRKVISNCLRNE